MKYTFDLQFGKMSGRVVCLIFVLAAIIPSILFARVFHYILSGSLPPNTDAVSILTAICVSAPLVIHTVYTIKRLDRSKLALRERSEALDASNVALAAARNGLSEANELLEKRVAERTAAADEARRNADMARLNAEEASRAKSMFLANMSHELRTPLNAIIGFSELIVHRETLIRENVDQTIDEYSDAVHMSGRQLLSLVNDLLDLSRIECGEFDIAPERLRVKSVVDIAAQSLQTVAEKRGQTIQSEVACESEYFRADSRAIQQVLTNLISNALKYSNEGSVVRVLVHDDATGTTFDIVDDGIGLGDGDAEQAVLPFARLSEAHIATGDSIGLGLAIVSSLCTLHGGRLELIPNETTGITARAYFPVQAGRAETSAAPELQRAG